MKLLVIGFEPFGEDRINASWEAVQELPCSIGDWSLEKVCLPVLFGKASETALQVARRCGAEAILCIGQAAGRSAVTPEKVAINLRSARISDNAGFQPLDEPVCADGPAAYFSSMPVRKQAEAISTSEIKAEVSFSAGTYVCNDLFYSLLHHHAHSGIRVGFIHIPPLPDQVKPGEPSLPLHRAVTAIIKAIETI